MKWSVLLFLVAPLLGQIEFGATLTSDYVWRGVTQTDDDPALQLGVQQTFSSGLYLRGWASNVNFDAQTDFEFDALVGFSKKLESGFSFDLSYVYYFYEGDADIEFGEAIAMLGYRWLSFYYVRDLENDNAYVQLGLSHTFAENWTLGAHYGDTQFDAGNDFLNWSVFVTRAWVKRKTNVTLTFTDTDLDGITQAEARVFVALTKTW